MEEHFYEAAIRHYVDGTILQQEECFDNAVYLYGNSAECALKSLIEVFCGERSGDILKYKYGHDGVNLKEDLFGFITNASIAPSLDPILGLKLQAFDLPEILFLDHPKRRYDKNGRYSQNDAERCKDAACFLIKELMKQHVDGYI